MLKIKKGLNLPIAGEPSSEIDDAKVVRSVAILGEDYPGMKPTMAVAIGDSVRKGQVLFSDKKTEGVVFTSPISGRVVEINRGAKRAFISLVIEAAGDAAESFSSYDANQLEALDRKTVIEQLLSSGAWTALRTRPFSRIPLSTNRAEFYFCHGHGHKPLGCRPQAHNSQQSSRIFCRPERVVETNRRCRSSCQDGSSALDASNHDSVTNHVFEGPHPAGLPGTHIHFVDPVSPNKTVWFVGYQDVIAIGHLFLLGTVFSERIVALGGPGVSEPRLIKTYVGANLEQLTAGELEAGAARYFRFGALGSYRPRTPRIFRAIPQPSISAS